VTPDPVPGEIQPQNTIPSTAGMTTKVVKGGLWTLGGQVLPMLYKRHPAFEWTAIAL